MKNLLAILLITGITGLIVASELTNNRISNSEVKISLLEQGPCDCGAILNWPNAIIESCGAYSPGSVVFNHLTGDYTVTGSSNYGHVDFVDCGVCCTEVVVTGTNILGECKIQDDCDL